MKEIILKELKKSLIRLNYYDKKIELNLTVPNNRDFGNLSTNISFLLSKKLKSSPIKIANNILYFIST